MDTLKTIKAINERMAVYERKGLTASNVYQELQAALDIMGIDKVEAKPVAGRDTGFRISRSKSNLAKLSTPEGQRQLQRINEIGGLKEERARVKKQLRNLGYKPTEEMIASRIQNYGPLVKWIEDNLTEVYSFARSVFEAGELLETFHDGIRNYDYSAIWEAIRDYENARDAWATAEASSGYAQATETAILQGEYRNPYEN